MTDHLFTRRLAARLLPRAAVVRGCLLGLVMICVPVVVDADEVHDWNTIMIRSVAAGAVPGPLTFRAASIVHASMFDALNGIDRRFTPIHVAPDAPRGASRRAAVVQAAYTALAGMFPAQLATLDDALEASLSAIASGPAADSSVSIDRGRLWGEHVAEEILAWRAGDDLAQTVPPTVGNNNPGQWRPTLPAFAPMSVPNMGSIPTWVIESPLDFRPGPPLSLTSPEYADEVNLVQSYGAAASVTRNAYQTESARFWAGTILGFWNRAAADASRHANLTLTENARLFAVLNIAAADALIVCWDSKLHYNFWRPITAIREADTDGNPATTADPTWLPLINTPPYPDYYSGHQSGTSAVVVVLTAYFGHQPVTGFSEGFGNLVRSYNSFAEAGEDAMMARFWSGIHFRFTQLLTREVGQRVAAYVLSHAAQPINGNHNGQTPD